MTEDAIVTIDSIPVMYIAGDSAMPVPAQANAAIDALEAALPSLRGRKCYGVVVKGQYRACVATQPEDDSNALGLSLWTVPGGRFAMRKLSGWLEDASIIPVAVEELSLREDLDSSRHIIEFYRSHRELRIMAPVK